MVWTAPAGRHCLPRRPCLLLTRPLRDHHRTSLTTHRLPTEGANTTEIRALLSSALTEDDSTTNFDFHALKSTIGTHNHATILEMHVLRAGANASGKPYAARKDASEERYRMYVYGDTAPTDAVALECVPPPLCLTPPHIKHRRFVRRAMVKPWAPHAPIISAAMVFAPDFGPYKAALAPFLCTLPCPFTFDLPGYPRDEKDEDPSAPQSLDAALERVLAAKQRGNAAFADLQRNGALDAYTSSCKWLRRAATRASCKEEERANALVAVVAANRAAVHLRGSPVAEFELHQAVQAGEVAEGMDLTYAKARRAFERGLNNVAECNRQQIQDESEKLRKA
ncbi:hypothetical protein FA95DRAFT_1599387 [Auriscalpium vulgare]|uniref:Uncharacterized protein n=1 Tax=Auriscalpium vulgare TaxID=40419 RepID=A0ACB8R9A3_9AGAM|nr:hypothetical protein FA95DRAFT_1599387 [Auriscalpium vulgare]